MRNQWLRKVLLKSEFPDVVNLPLTYEMIRGRLEFVGGILA